QPGAHHHLHPFPTRRSSDLIPNPGPGDEFRIGGAPCAWTEDGQYYALTGNSHNTPDTAYLYTSSDLAHWRYLHPFYRGGFFTEGDRKSTRLNSSHLGISYAV